MTIARLVVCLAWIAPAGVTLVMPQRVKGEEPGGGVSGGAIMLDVVRTPSGVVFRLGDHRQYSLPQAENRLAKDQRMTAAARVNLDTLGKASGPATRSVLDQITNMPMPYAPEVIVRFAPAVTSNDIASVEGMLRRVGRSYSVTSVVQSCGRTGPPNRVKAAR